MKMMHIIKLNNGMNTEHIISILDSFVIFLFVLLFLFGIRCIFFPVFFFSFPFSFVLHGFSSVLMAFVVTVSFFFLFFYLGNVHEIPSPVQCAPLPQNDQWFLRFKGQFYVKRYHYGRRNFQQIKCIFMQSTVIYMHFSSDMIFSVKNSRAMATRWAYAALVRSVASFTEYSFCFLIFHFLSNRNETNIKMPNWSELPTTRHSVTVNNQFLLIQNALRHRSHTL